MEYGLFCTEEWNNWELFIMTFEELKWKLGIIMINVAYNWNDVNKNKYAMSEF